MKISPSLIERVVPIDRSAMNTPVILDPAVSGLYLGWVRNDTKVWEPIARMMAVSGGYIAHYTSNRKDIVTKYKGFRDLLIHTQYNSELGIIIPHYPSVFEARMPLRREDVRDHCEYMKIDYPDIDKLAYCGRWGGRIGGDPFSICPIVEASEDGDYIFYVGLAGMEDDLQNANDWERIRQSTEFTLVETGDKYCYGLKLGNRVIGHFREYFNLIDGELIEISIINFTDHKKWQGTGMLLKIVIRSNNPYKHDLFEVIEEIEDVETV
jgi:hypothetical protein